MDGKSGFFDRIIETLGEDGRISLLPDKHERAYYDYLYGHKDDIDGAIRKYFQDIRQHTEELVLQTKTPVSAGEIFSYCLDRNNGSIDKSLVDTTLFLKYMARNDITLITFERIEPDKGKLADTEAWFQKNIKDEYGKVGCYTELTAETYPYNGRLSTLPGAAWLEVDKDLHLRNQIGKPYHAWNIVTLLSALPPTVVQMGVAYRQYITFDAQGPVKTAADFRVALELRKLNSLFMMYS